MVLVEDGEMVKMYQLVTAAAVTLALTGTAMAYGTQPNEAVTKDRVEGTQVAEACMPRLSPQMAAAFGLPLTPPGEIRTCTTG